jgi:hypothetical protein
MDRYPPRHLYRHRAAPAARLTTIGWLAVALTGLALLAAMVAAQAGTGFGPAPRRAPTDVTVMSVPSAVPAQTSAAGADERFGASTTVSTRSGSVSQLPDPSFETGLAGWRPAAGTRLDRVGSARDGRWAANFSATPPAGAGVVAPKVATVKAKVTYLASLWLRSSRPATAVEVELIELVHGRRFSADTVGAILGGVAWQRLEIAHQGHRTGTVLALEVRAPDLPGPASVSLDVIDVRVGPNGMSVGPS